jgi:ribonuclease D
VRSAGAPPARLFDLQIAAGLVGRGYPASLGQLVSQVIGESIEASEKRTDWRQRPLTERQLNYAYQDVKYLKRIHDSLSDELSRMKRSAWADDEFRRFSAALVEYQSGERTMKIGGTSGLSARKLTVLKHLFRWRESKARALDLPVRRIVRDDVLVDLAKRLPTSRVELEKTRGLDMSRKFVPELLQALAEGQKAPIEVDPRNERRRESPDEQMALKVLSAVLIDLGRRIGVAPTQIANQEELRELMEWYAEGKPTDRAPRITRGWRGEAVAETLGRAIEGKLKFSIGRGSNGYHILFDDD